MSQENLGALHGDDPRRGNARRAFDASGGNRAHRRFAESGGSSREETAAISLDREVFENGIAHEDGAITLQLGGVEFVIARRE